MHQRCQVHYIHNALSTLSNDALQPAIDELGFAAEGTTTVTTWSPIRDEALKKPPPTGYPRSDLKPVRTSSEKSCGCSQAAKCPPLATLLKWMRLWYERSVQLRGAW